MAKPSDVYILLDEIDLAQERQTFISSDYDKNIMRISKAKADQGVRLTAGQWDRLVSLYLRSQGREINET